MLYGEEALFSIAIKLTTRSIKLFIRWNRKNGPKLYINHSNIENNHRVCCYLPSALEMAKKGTDSVWVLLLTGPLWPWWTGLSHATRGTPFRERTFPPRDSIRVFSDGTSGLWSAVRATAWSFFSLFNRPSAARESPTWAMYSVLPLRITTVAVVPDVLGNPCLVRGQESANELVRNNRFKSMNYFKVPTATTLNWWAPPLNSDKIPIALRDHSSFRGKCFAILNRSRTAIWGQPRGFENKAWS